MFYKLAFYYLILSKKGLADRDSCVRDKTLIVKHKSSDSLEHILACKMILWAVIFCFLFNAGFSAVQPIPSAEVQTVDDPG